MSGNLNTNNHSSATPPSQNQQLMYMLMGPKAYEYAAGLLMAVWGNVASEEMKVNMENAKLNAQAAGMQSQAVGMQATASIVGGVSNATTSIMQATTGVVQGGMYAKNAADMSSAQSELEAAKNTPSTSVSTNGPISQNGPTGDPEAMKAAQAKIDKLTSEQYLIRPLGEAAQALAQSFGALGKGFTDAAGALAGNGASMFTQVEQELAANQSAANQTLQGILQNEGQLGQIALAGARG